MPGLTYGLGKGLREPCSPYREAYVFGAEPFVPEADNWNCIAVIVSPTTTFDLSAITTNHEVVVALIGFSNTLSGSYNFRFRWYRDRDNALIVDMSWAFSATRGGWVFSYCYIGYHPQEINENGDYHVDISVSGAESHLRTIAFTVTGIPAEEPIPPVTVGVLSDIVHQFNVVSSFFYSIYSEVLGWIYPFWLIASPFYAASHAFSHLAWRFYDFSEWVYYISNKIGAVFSWDTIWSYILTVIPNLEEIRDWFWFRWYHIQIMFWDFWAVVRGTVIGWVNEAKQYARLWIDYLQSQVNSLSVKVDEAIRQIPNISELMSWFSNWTGNVMTTINAWWTGALTEVQDLINSAFIVRESLWAGWQDWRDKVAEFFTDPEDWLYKSLDRIIERFW